MRVGVLGCSDIAQRKFIPALLQCEQACLTALGSRKQGRFSAGSGVAVPLLTYEDLVSDPSVDLVYISLPNHLHEEWSIRALEQGKHVICEKPLGLSAASVERMLAVADNCGRFLFENLMYLQHPQHRVVQGLISAGRIGRILAMKSEFAFPGPVDGDFRLDPAMGGGAFYDMNRYPLSAALFFLKGKSHRFLRGFSELLNGLTWSLQADSITDANEEFSFQVAFGQPYRSFYELRGERGVIRVERAYTTPAEMENRITVTIEGRDESFGVPPGDHFLHTLDYVCGLIRSGQWGAEHEGMRTLAALADMFHDKCIRREPEHGN